MGTLPFTSSSTLEGHKLLPTHRKLFSAELKTGPLSTVQRRLRPGGQEDEVGAVMVYPREGGVTHS